MCLVHLLRCLDTWSNILPLLASCWGEGGEVKDEVGYWCVHVYYACFIDIELHVVFVGVLLQGGEDLLQDSSRSGEKYYIICIC